ncbi:MAG: sodium:proton antiporter, partial [Methylicorpusculum sp.]|nr:sodium:proton antiporter [Methylicorpusculum sp.]
MKIVFNSMLFNLFLFLPLPAWSSEFDINRLNLTSETGGYIALFIFFLAYTLVIFEEKLHLQKSKPVL